MEDLIANPEQNRERWRRNRLAAIKRQIEDGTYLDDEKIAATVSTLLNELSGEGDRQMQYIVKDQKPSSSYPYANGYAIWDTQTNQQVGYFANKARAECAAETRNKSATADKGDFVANVERTLPVAAAEEAEDGDRFDLCD